MFGFFKNNSYQNLSVEAFAEGIQKAEAIVIDVRSPQEYREAHLPNAKIINIQDADFIQKISQLDPEAHYYVYCRSGGRSSSACQLMSKQGFRNLYNLSGGIMAWKAKGQAVKR